MDIPNLCASINSHASFLPLESISIAVGSLRLHSANHGSHGLGRRGLRVGLAGWLHRYDALVNYSTDCWSRLSAAAEQRHKVSTSLQSCCLTIRRPHLILRHSSPGHFPLLHQHPFRCLQDICYHGAQLGETAAVCRYQVYFSRKLRTYADTHKYGAYHHNPVCPHARAASLMR